MLFAKVFEKQGNPDFSKLAGGRYSAAIPSRFKFKAI
jgi:hypothetical protein